MLISVRSPPVLFCHHPHGRRQARPWGFSFSLLDSSSNSWV